MFFLHGMTCGTACTFFSHGFACACGSTPWKCPPVFSCQAAVRVRSDILENFAGRRGCAERALVGRRAEQALGRAERAQCRAGAGTPVPSGHRTSVRSLPGAVESVWETPSKERESRLYVVDLETRPLGFPDLGSYRFHD